MIEKDLENERPIPDIWRLSLKNIADSIVDEKPYETVPPVKLNDMDARSLEISLGNIGAYPDEIGGLSEKTWETSIYIWMDGYWNILLDLTDTDGQTSDLVLDGKMYEDGEAYIFKPYLIYVP